MIYFMQPVGGGPIKIGCTGNLDNRRRDLEKYYGHPLVVLATQRGGRAKERRMHDRFAHLRLGRTEQFQPAPELLGFIGRPLLVCPNPDAVEAIRPVANVTIINLKGVPAFRDWVAGTAARTGMSASALLRSALLEWAERYGYPPPPRMD